MKINELMAECKKIIDEGYGDVEVFVEDADENQSINSIQKDTMPDVEPNYFFIMSNG